MVAVSGWDAAGAARDAVLSPAAVAFCSGTEELNRELLDRIASLYPGAELWVVAEFPPHRGEWIQYHPSQNFRENLARVREGLAGRKIQVTAALMMPRRAYGTMRLIAMAIAPGQFAGFDERGRLFTLRSPGRIARHAAWRLRERARWHLQPGGRIRLWARRIAHPSEAAIPLLTWIAYASMWLRHTRRVDAMEAEVRELREGISVVIPSRNGRVLLAEMLPAVMAQQPSEVIVVNNGSDDGTAEWLASEYPEVRTEISGEPLSFARAVNRGIKQARFARACLLNNDMAVAPEFLSGLAEKFERVPDLFCATAQIFFPQGKRREETGKAVFRAVGPLDFPIRCEEPLAGEDETYVLYGSAGCSLYDTAKLSALGGFGEIFEPAYVEDLDAGYRAWQRGWPTVLAAGAHVIHRHRATTGRYHSEEDLAAMVEINYLRFLGSAVGSAELFTRLWKAAIRRLQLLAMRGELPARRALGMAWKIPRGPVRVERASEESFLALTGGDVAVFPGRRTGRQVVTIASPYLPYPLAHGGAVRIFNLMREGAKCFDLVLLTFTDELATPPSELMEICAEIVLVKRTGSHKIQVGSRPRMVEEFDSASFREALRQTVKKWQPRLVQLEFTEMAQYAEDCQPAKTILVEHDITFDLHEQLLRGTEARSDERREQERELARWRAFETDAWTRVDAIVTMSEKDRTVVGSANARCLPNGVDLERFRPASEEPEPGRLLFLGSFAHLPNLLAMEFFLHEVWPRLTGMKQHIIAGSRQEYFMQYYKKPLFTNSSHPGIVVEDFVADVRPAYRKAAIVIAPLVASAGTNIKILEAMAMGKAIVTTSFGVNGLLVRTGQEVLVADEPEEMAEAIRRVSVDSQKRKSLESNARTWVEREFGWDEIGERQSKLYEEFIL